MCRSIRRILNILDTIQTRSCDHCFSHWCVNTFVAGALQQESDPFVVRLGIVIASLLPVRENYRARRRRRRNTLDYCEREKRRQKAIVITAAAANCRTETIVGESRNKSKPLHTHTHPVVRAVREWKRNERMADATGEKDKRKIAHQTVYNFRLGQMKSDDGGMENVN